MKSALIFLLIATVGFAQPAEDHVSSWQVPQRVKECLASFAGLAATELKLNLQINPYYLRGDFDGNGRTDLAIALRSRTDDTKLGTGICREGLPSVLLGAIAKGKPFSDDPADSVASIGWTVVSRDRLLRILKKSNPARHGKTRIRSRLSVAKGEMIYMPYEDAEGVIYYLGGRFYWYTINSTLLLQR